MKPLLKLKLALRESPTFFRTVYGLRQNDFLGNRIALPGTDLVIEGYPRSGNTFAQYAFADAQREPVTIANHFHSSAQFALARRHGVPAMLVLRDPIDAACSLLIFMGNVDAEAALLRYIAFHRPLVGLQDAFITAPFSEIISNFGATINRLNAHFGTEFSRFDHTEEAVARIEQKMLNDKQQRVDTLGAKFQSPLRTSYPNAEKKRQQEIVRPKFDAPGLTSLKKECYRLHDRLSICD